MKRTPMSTARAVGNRKLTYAMIERNRSTNRARTVTYAQRCADDATDNINNLLKYKDNKTKNLQVTSTMHVVPAPSNKRYLPARPYSGGHDREFSPDVSIPLTFFLPYMP